jgi:hypothetical protein
VSECADHFKQATLREAAMMSAEQRVLRALALGQSDLEIYASASGLSLQQARSDVRRRRELERLRVIRSPER